MSAFDNFVAMKVLYMLVTPFEKTEAFKLGVIDKQGDVLIKFKDQTSEQKKTFTYLDRMVFNIKKLIGKAPGGKSQLASIIAGLYLIKEKHEERLSDATLEKHFNELIEKIQNVVLVEEQIMIEKFFELMKEEDGAPANVTGSAVSTDIPVVKKKTALIKRKVKVNGDTT